MNISQNNIILKIYKYKYRLLLYLFRKNINSFWFRFIPLFSGKNRSSSGSCRYNQKKTILIIDSNVPKYNCSAGERTTWQYIDMFLEMDFDVFFMPDDFKEIQPYTQELFNKGIKCLCGDSYEQHYDSWIMKNGFKLDYVLLNRPMVAVKYMDLLKRYSNAKIIYYGMDIHHIRESEQYKVTNDAEHFKLSEYFKKIELYLYKKADVILTVSAEEESVIKGYGYNNIKVFPVYFYKDFNTAEYIPSQRNNILFVGGEKHPPNPDAVIWFIEEILPEFIKKIQNVKFIVVGRYSNDFVAKYSSENVMFIVSADDEELKTIYNTVKIVAVPLRFGAGIKGKTIEAGYYGIPVVSTKFGLEGLPDISKILNPKNTAEEFKNELTTIYNDDAKLKEMSLRLSEYVKNRFSYENAVEKIKSVLGNE